MAAPINNGLHNIPPSGLSSSAVIDGEQSAHTSSAAPTSSPSSGPLSRNPASIPTGNSSGNPLALPSSGQNIDWFSDLDAGSKLPIGVSDRLQGKSIQEMTDIIMGHLGLHTGQQK